MAIGLNSNAIPGGLDGNKLILVNCDSTTFDLTTTVTAGVTVFDLGDISSSDIVQESSKSEKKSENSQTKKTSHTISLGTKAVLMQEDKPLLDFLASTVKGKRYLELKYNGYIDSQYQWYLKFVEVTPAINIHRSGESATLNYESTGIFPDAAEVLSTTTLASVATALNLSNFPTAATIPLADGYAIVNV